MRIQNILRISWFGLSLLAFSFSACAQPGKEADKQPKAPEKATSAASATGATPAGAATPAAAAAAPAPGGAEKLTRPAGLLSDSTGLLSGTDKSEIEDVLRRLREKAQIDFAIAIIDSTNGMDIFNYSLELVREWKIGSQNGGVLLVIAVKDRKWHIQIDKRLEKDLTNNEVKNIGEVMLPDFRENKHADGIKKCIEKMISVLAAKQKFEPIKFKTPDQKQ